MRLYNFRIIIIFFFGVKLNKHTTIYTKISIAFLYFDKQKLLLFSKKLKKKNQEIN